MIITQLSNSKRLVTRAEEVWKVNWLGSAAQVETKKCHALVYSAGYIWLPYFTSLSTEH